MNGHVAEWFVRLPSGDICGPYRESQIRRGLEHGKIPERASIRQNGSEWIEGSLVRARFRELEREGWYVFDTPQARPRGPFTQSRLTEMVKSQEIGPRACVRQGLSGTLQPVGHVTVHRHTVTSLTLQKATSQRSIGAVPDDSTREGSARFRLLLQF